MRLRHALCMLILTAACGKSSTKAPPAEPGSASAVAPPASEPSAPPVGNVSNPFDKAVPLACDQAARDVPGSEGSVWYMRCPACAALDGAVWGTDLYTDDSNICAAAAHAGALTKTGGVVLVTWTPGEKTYIGTKRNGVESRDYGAWGRSFFVQTVDATGKPTSPAVAPTPAGTVRLSCAMGWSVLDIKEGASVRVSCPPGCTRGSVWGTDVYTGDSSICTAAVHAGAITADKGGPVNVTLGGAKDTFAGSERNGVTSSSYAHFDASFTLAP